MPHTADTDSPSTGLPAKRARRKLLKDPRGKAALAGANWGTLASGKRTDFVHVFAMPSLQRADLIKVGAPSRLVGVISKEMALSQDQFARITGLARATVVRKMANGTDLSPDESERLVGLARLIGQVESMVRESGDADGFSAARWFAQWISQPVDALGGRKPETLLDTADGREAVARVLAQMQSGAFA